MKQKIILAIGLFQLGFNGWGQQSQTPYTTPFATTPAQAVTTSNAAWYRGGNNNTGSAGNANIFGTLWNSPIYTVTNGLNRSKLNGTFTAVGATAQYGIDGYTTFGNTNTTVNTSGYMLLGPNGTFQTQPGLSIYNNKGAYSLLHLNGTAPIQQNGYRPWMKTGITFTDNQDMSYFGLRQIHLSFSSIPCAEKPKIA